MYLEICSIYLEIIYCMYLEICSIYLEITYCMYLEICSIYLEIIYCMYFEICSIYLEIYGIYLETRGMCPQICHKSRDSSTLLYLPCDARDGESTPYYSERKKEREKAKESDIERKREKERDTLTVYINL